MISIKRPAMIATVKPDQTDAYMVESIVNYVIALKGRRKYRGGSCIREKKSRNVADFLVHVANEVHDHIRNFVKANWSAELGFEDQDFHTMADFLSKDLDLCRYGACNFMAHCCKISLLATIMYDCDFNKAPQMAQQHILNTIGLYKSRSLFDESRWRYLNSALFHYIIDNDAFQ